MRHLPLAEPAPRHAPCVAQVPVFAGLTPAEQLDVARLARPVRLHDGERLYGPGDPRPRLAVVHRGRLRVSRPTADGRDRVLRVVGPGEVVGEVEVLTGRAPTDLVRALGETRVCAFRPGDLDELLGHSSVARAAIRALAERLARSDEATAVAGASPVVARLAAYLLAQPRAGAPGREVLRLPLARTDIASLLGTTPESLSRALRTLRDAGAVEGGRGRVLVLLDTGHLEELARR